MRIARLNAEINPVVTVGSTRSVPRSAGTSKHTWLQRKVRVFHYQSTATPVVLTAGDIVSSMNDFTEDDGILREFCVRQITAWNATAPAKTSNYIRGRTYANITTSDSEKYAEGFGTASKYPGVTFNIPDAHAEKIKAYASTSTIGIADFVTYTLGGTLESKQTLVFDVLVDVLVL